MNHQTTYAVDLAKSVFEIAVSNHPGHVCERHRLSRERFLTFFAQQKPGTVLLEACGSAHHWARSLSTIGHDVVLLPPHRVRPYVTGNKTDSADAKALLEAARNQDIRPVPVKSIDQQSLAALLEDPDSALPHAIRPAPANAGDEIGDLERRSTGPRLPEAPSQLQCRGADPRGRS